MLVSMSVPMLAVVVLLAMMFGLVLGITLVD